MGTIWPLYSLELENCASLGGVTPNFSLSALLGELRAVAVDYSVQSGMESPELADGQQYPSEDEMNRDYRWSCSRVVRSRSIFIDEPAETGVAYRYFIPSDICRRA